MATAGRAFGFSLDEDDALKRKLENYGKPFQIVNYADHQLIPVTVYFRSPDIEIRNRSFPRFTIDLIDIEPDYERMHRSAGYGLSPQTRSWPPPPSQWPTPHHFWQPRHDSDLDWGPVPKGTSIWANDYPFPWTLTYQISAFSRDPTHDRQLGQILYHMFPFQYGQLDMGWIDSTSRRADLREVTRQDIPADQSNKRVFRQIFTIAVSSEFYLDPLTGVPLVREVDLDVEETTSGTEDKVIITEDGVKVRPIKPPEVVRQR